MAQKVQTLFIDDIDGGATEGTVRFGLDGTDYEIDLSGDHNDELHKALERYIARARKVRGNARRSSRGGGRQGSSSVDTTAVRTWAREQGIGIKERGRVPADVLARYKAATGS